jgi:hypothetical protein
VVGDDSILGPTIHSSVEAFSDYIRKIQRYIPDFKHTTTFIIKRLKAIAVHRESRHNQ